MHRLDPSLERQALFLRNEFTRIIRGTGTPLSTDAHLTVVVNYVDLPAFDCNDSSSDRNIKLALGLRFDPNVVTLWWTSRLLSCSCGLDCMLLALVTITILLRLYDDRESLCLLSHANASANAILYRNSSNVWDNCC